MTTNPNPSESVSTPAPEANSSSGTHLSPDGSHSGNGAVGKSIPPFLPTKLPGIERSRPTVPPLFGPAEGVTQRSPISGIVLIAAAIMLVGLGLNNFWIGIVGAIVVLVVSGRVVWTAVRPIITDIVSAQQWTLTICLITGALGIWGTLRLLGGDQSIAHWFGQANWDAVGALGEVFGALGQILIAVLALYVAWRQYVIEKDLTLQQNIITQQQTIDSYFQGVSDLVLDEEGLLEDWPQERAIAEARTAAIISSVDAGGKAKIIRFLSRANLLTPLKRDQRLGRPILDGAGGYAEDRVQGVRVIDLGVMLAGANLSGTDLRWTDLSEANLIRVNLSRADLVKTNLTRTILVEADLRGADLKGTRFFYGKAEMASPRSQTEPPDYRTGEHTGAVIENADFTEATEISLEQRYYCCAWGGSRSRNTIPGGCDGIPNKLGR